MDEFVVEVTFGPFLVEDRAIVFAKKSERLTVERAVTA